MPSSYSIAITGPSYLITAFEMLLVALVAGHLTAGLTRKAAEAASRERMLSSAYCQKLEEDPTQPRFILTEAGVGYRFHSPA